MIRILCDRSVLQRYVDALAQAEWIEMIQSEDVFPDDAPDQEISEYAAREGWVVFTEDDDFLGFAHNRGVILYHHIERPLPGEVISAIREVAQAYDDHRQITEYVPGEWTDD